MAIQLADYRGRRLTLDDYNALPDDADYEVIDGVLYVAARPRPDHQSIHARLIILVGSHVESTGLGRIMPDADLIVTARGTYVSPDIMYFTSEQWARIDRKKQIRVIPTLIVEILSPSNMRHDLVRKRREYARIGVPHYWIVDPEQPGLVECILRDDGHYVDREVEQDEPFRSALFPDLEIDLARLFA